MNRGVMGDLLQVSLFKLADRYHDLIGDMTQRYPWRAQELKGLSGEVEAVVDEALRQFRDGGDVTMELIDELNRRVVDLTNLRDRPD